MALLSSITTRLPCWAPALRGEKVTPMLQLIPGNSIGGHWGWAWKSPVAVIAPMVSGPSPRLMRVTICGDAGAPTFAVNASVPGVSCADGMVLNDQRGDLCRLIRRVELSEADGDGAARLRLEELRAVVALREKAAVAPLRRVGSIDDADQLDFQQAASIVGQADHRRGGGAIRRLVNRSRGWGQGDERGGGLSVEDDLLRPTEGVIGNQHAAQMRAERPRLEDHLEGAARAGLEPGVGAVVG